MLVRGKDQGNAITVLYHAWWENDTGVCESQSREVSFEKKGCRPPPHLDPFMITGKTVFFCVDTRDSKKMRDSCLHAGDCDAVAATARALLEYTHTLQRRYLSW